MPQTVSLKLSNSVIQVLQLQVSKRDDVEHANVHLKAFLCVLETNMTSSFLRSWNNCLSLENIRYDWQIFTVSCLGLKYFLVATSILEAVIGFDWQFIDNSDSEAPSGRVFTAHYKIQTVIVPATCNCNCQKLFTCYKNCPIWQHFEHLTWCEK